ncbi:DUF1801 domain-containing protein [candidate division KSB1 bacterium]|nr:DUF1801 domain-containing protein [candidate division KSB1 bacterium]
MDSNKKIPNDINEYIKMFPQNIQTILERLRQTIRNASPEAEETINYQIPTFKLNGNLVHFAAYKNHIGFYPTPSGIEAFKEELSNYEVAKGSVKFPINEELPWDLIRKIVEYRVIQNLEKKK